MRLTVLGNTGRYLAPLSGGTSYLVEHAGTRILLDAGGGAREALAGTGIDRLDAVVLSHFHFDHVLDFVTMRDLLDDTTRVFVPPGERRRLDALAEAYAFRGAWDLPAPVVEATGTARVGALALDFAPTRHSAPSFATRLQAEGRALVYAGDTAPCAPLAHLARDADVLLMHTLLPVVDPASDHARRHATAATAGSLAADVGARRLLLSHRYHESSDAAMRDAAARAFPRVELARDAGVYDVEANKRPDA